MANYLAAIDLADEDSWAGIIKATVDMATGLEGTRVYLMTVIPGIIPGIDQRYAIRGAMHGSGDYPLQQWKKDAEIKLKEIAGELSERDLLDRDVFTRHLSLDDIEGAGGEDSFLQVNLFQLMDAFKRVIEERSPEGTLEFRPEPWSLKDKTTLIVERLKQEGTLYFKGHSGEYQVFR